VATARLGPPPPVWKEQPFFSIPDARMRPKASSAMRSCTGSRVTRVAPVAIFDGSPMESTTATWSTRYWGTEILGARGYSTRLSVTAMTWSAYRASTMA
jgi:hypothetical protein